MPQGWLLHIVTEINTSYSKIGTLGSTTDFKNVQCIKLKEHDVLFIGSDGKDDIILKATSTTTRTMNKDDFFQKLSRRQREILQKYLRN